MKDIRKIILGLGIATAAVTTSFAGNPDRSGQAGATQLLVNPWARSSGWGNADMAGVRGVESMFLNVGGLTGTRKAEFGFARSNWLGNVGISVNSFGMAIRVGKSGSNALGLSLMSFNFGDIPMTTESQPEGMGTYSIQTMNIGFGFAHKFSDNISGGFILRSVTEGTASVKASGMALDAGIQYKAGKMDRVKFGVALKNVGPALKFSGSALDVRGIPEGSDHSITLETRSSTFEMPSMLSISSSYDLAIMGDTLKPNKITIAGNYVSNSFSRDQLSIGAQYSYRNWIMIHAGYVYEKGIFSGEARTNAFRGPAAGISVDVPFGKDHLRRFGIDYSYRAANPFGGTHTFGARLNL